MIVTKIQIIKSILIFVTLSLTAKDIPKELLEIIQKVNIKEYSIDILKEVFFEDPMMKYKIEDLQFEDVDTELMLAILKNDLKLVQRAIKKGADVNSYDLYGNTPLIAASIHSSKEVIIKLLNMGADINTYNNTDMSPIISLTNRSNIPLEDYKILLMIYINHGAIINNDIMILNNVIINADIETVNYILKLGIDINKKDDSNNSTLYNAIRTKNLELISLLIRNGAKLNETNEAGFTALMHALFLDDINSMRLLLEKGANIQIKDHLNNTVLDYALKKGDEEIIELLYKYL